MLSRKPGNGSTPSGPRESSGRKFGEVAWLVGREFRRFENEEEIDSLLPAGGGAEPGGKNADRSEAGVVSSMAADDCGFCCG